MQCTSLYPTPDADVNLKAIETLSSEFGVPIGFSDHSLGIEVSLAAVALGSIAIEKHFTLDKQMEGPDHLMSLNPKELVNWVSGIRRVEQALGDGCKVPADGEFEMRENARRSLVSSAKIRKGEVFGLHNITAKRPGTGLSPINWKRIMGLKSNRDYEKDELIDLNIWD